MSDIIFHVKNVMNYEFKDKNLCIQALTHSSIKNDVQYANATDNEKLEFIGDAVLDLIVSNFLLSNEVYSKNEGDLTINRAKIVNEKSLFKFAQYISLNKYLKVSNSALKMKIQMNESVLADAFEALIGAIFLDSNFETVKCVVLNLLETHFIETLNNEHSNYKGLLNEHISKYKLSQPIYEIISISGPDHDRIYTCQIIIDDKIIADGCGNSIKKAEQDAAKYAMIKLEVL